jgi:hypothetical protein
VICCAAAYPPVCDILVVHRLTEASAGGMAKLQVFGGATHSGACCGHAGRNRAPGRGARIDKPIRESEGAA